MPKPAERHDVDEWRMRADSHLTSQGLNPLRRNGAEWVGACPVCGDGDDRFSIKPRSDGGTHFHCRAQHHPREFFETLFPDLNNSGPPTYPPSKPLVANAASPVARSVSRRVAPKLTPSTEPPEDLNHPKLRKPSRTWPVCDADGRLVAVHARFETPEGKTTRWWRNGRWSLKAHPDDTGPGSKDMPLYGCHLLTKFDRARPVFVVEGEKSADAGRDQLGLQCVATVTGSASIPVDRVLSILAGWPGGVVLWSDRDSDPNKGPRHMQRIGEALQRIDPALTVQLLDIDRLAQTYAERLEVDPADVLPDGSNDPDEDGGDAADLADAFDLWGDDKCLEDLDEVLTTCSERVELSAEALETYRQIEITPREDEMVDKTIQRLQRARKNIYVRGGMLVDIVPDDDDAAASIRQIPDPRMRELIASCCSFWRRNAKGEQVTKHVPAIIPMMIGARGFWPGFPVLKSITEHPTMLPDGSILQRPGYDPASKIYCKMSERFETVPSNPTAEDVRASIDLLKETVCDFPFETKAHRSAWLAGLLAPLARQAIDGNTPFHLIDANIRGAGKSLLGDVVSLILTGRPAGRVSYSGNQEEFRKSVTSFAMKGASLILLDNLAGMVGDATLDRALTSQVWEDRILGTNEVKSIPLNAVWFATGNNVILNEDTVRRTLHIRLDHPDEKPELKTDFRHPDISAWIRSERRRILPAALTLLRSYHVAGRPDQGLSGWGSFEAWSTLIRGCLVFHGFPDPADTREELASLSDVKTLEQKRLVLALEDVIGTQGRTVKEILDGLELHPEAREALLEVCPTREGLPSSRKVAKALQKLRRRNFDGRFLNCEKGRGGIMRYAVHRQDE